MTFASPGTTSSTSSTCRATRRRHGISTRFQTSRRTRRVGAAGARVRLRPLCAGAVPGRQIAGRRSWTTVAKEMSRLTGLSVDYIKEANLRVSPTRFRKEVLRDDRKTLGRYDMRFEGVDLDAAGENPSYDASDTGITGAFVAAIHDYLERELKYESTDNYRPTAYDIVAVGLQSPANRAAVGRGPGGSSCSRMSRAIWPLRSGRIRISGFSRPMATSTWQRRFSQRNSTSNIWTWSRNCAGMCSSAITHPGT